MRGKEKKKVDSHIHQHQAATMQEDLPCSQRAELPNSHRSSSACCSERWRFWRQTVCRSKYVVSLQRAKGRYIIINIIIIVIVVIHSLRSVLVLID